jgi:hypothetical protein
MAKKITQAQKIRNYHVVHPTASIAEIAKKLGIRYQAVYAVLKPNPKKPKKIIIHRGEAEMANKLGISIKDYAEQIHRISKGRKRVRPIMIDMTQKADGTITEKVTEIPKVGDTVGGLTLTRKALTDNTYAYRWVHEDAVKSGKVLVDDPSSTTDNVNHPAHYKTGGIETIDFIEAKGFGYNLGNVVKYISRADNKGNREEDLLKARWYLNREIAKFTKE